MVQQRKLGNDGPDVSALGLGCMGMSEFYGAHDDAESIATIHRALDLGVTFLDTADMYGVGHNGALGGRAIAERRDSVFLATKFVNDRGADGGALRRRGRQDRVCRAGARDRSVAARVGSGTDRV